MTKAGGDMASQMMPRNAQGSVKIGAPVSPREYERLALEMLAVEAGDVAEVKEAMRKIIASAPEGADTACLLSRALAHAGDRALSGSAPVGLSWGLGSSSLDTNTFREGSKRERSPSRWWAAVAVPFLVAAVIFWRFGYLALQTPDDRSDAAGMTALSMFVMSVGSLGAALIGVETLFLLRWSSSR